jgi:uncharacterized protein
MTDFIISKKIRDLTDYKYLLRKFGNSYIRQVDHHFSCTCGDRMLLVNSFFLKNIIEVTDDLSSRMFGLLSHPMSLYYFLSRIASSFDLNFKSPDLHDIGQIKKILKSIRTLVKFKFIVPAEFNEYNELERMRKHVMSRRLHPYSIYIINSVDCNFRCPECFIYRGNFRNSDSIPPHMTEELFDKQHSNLLKMIPRNDDSFLSFTFYGGEPLTNVPLIKHAASKIRQLELTGIYGNYQPLITIVTNASLIDIDFVEVIKKYRIRVTVSFDGRKSSHDKSRLLAGGKSSFNKVLQGIRILEDNDIPYSLSWIIGPENIDATPSDLKWVAKHLNAKDIFFSFRRDINGHTFKDTSPEVFYSKMNKIYDSINDNGLNESRLLFYRRIFSKDLSIPPSPYYCAAAGGGQIVMRPDGKIGICHAGILQDEEQWQYPEDIGTFSQNPIFMRWLRRSPLFMKKCYLECAYFSRCPGGCPYWVEEATGSMYEPSDDSCMIECFLIERAICEDSLIIPSIISASVP